MTGTPDTVLATFSRDNGELPAVKEDDALATLAAELDAAVERINELEVQVAELETKIEQQTVVTDSDDLTTLERYVAMPPGDRDELLSTSQQRAVAIFEHWWELAEETQAGWVVSTRRNSRKKHNPSQFKLDLERATGEGSLEWMQIYRAMQEVAQLSGGDAVRDDYDRLHIHGGAFEYHEKPTPDGQELYKHLVLTEPDSLTLL